jgi:hypothetical protein
MAADQAPAATQFRMLTLAQALPFSPAEYRKW